MCKIGSRVAPDKRLLLSLDFPHFSGHAWITPTEVRNDEDNETALLALMKWSKDEDTFEFCVASFFIRLCVD